MCEWSHQVVGGDGAGKVDEARHVVAHVGAREGAVHRQRARALEVLARERLREGATGGIKRKLLAQWSGGEGGSLACVKMPVYDHEMELDQPGRPSTAESRPTRPSTKPCAERASQLPTRPPRPGATRRWAPTSPHTLRE